MADHDLVSYGLVRVDDRLLHGQVVLNWARYVRPTLIAVVDDSVAHDAVASSLLRSVAPGETDLWIGAAAEAATVLVCRNPQHVMLILRDIETARRLFDAGVRYATLNVGCVGFAEGRRRISPQVALTMHEREVLQSLQRAGVTVTLQTVPSERPLRLDKVRWDGPSL